MHVYIYFCEKQPRRVNLWFSVFEEKLLCHETLTFYSFFKASIWNLHALIMYSIYGIEEIDVSRENLCYILWCKKRKQLCFETLLSCV